MPDYLLSLKQRNYFGLKARNSVSISVEPIRYMAWEDPFWPEIWFLARWKSICAYCFCLVVKQSGMHRNLRKRKTSDCSERIQLLRFFLPTKFKVKFGLLSKGWIFDARCIRRCPKKKFDTKQKTSSAALQWMLILHRTHLPQTIWQSRIKLESMFPCGWLRILLFKIL